ncbi:RnfH family protein [Xanthomonas sacchari]|uniref:RnfH family protein n=1 Tax=Xanthomonas TaxID=338 RepID=UPI00036234C8|nr:MULTISPECIES: RnfH family protein [Xanthomonas]MCW0402290.1 Persistence and stress-resistance antitoxin PasI [Xanthomonas sacchari]MCW0410132.1 Persistence and stress-resistance antitoxin PasI [Xanthomonas sacchari]MCW0415132.1 Persistence and stress-resistance antitoxin PasI [Xanthomonas sacchari]UYK68310.1 RnfH family protein [Xanthomonas sacchari]
MQVEVVLAWSERFVSQRLELPEGATVADALAAAALPEATPGMPCAVYGEVAAPTRLLQDGDRVELLRPLLIDPKDARRRRAKPR